MQYEWCPPGMRALGAKRYELHRPAYPDRPIALASWLRDPLTGRLILFCRLGRRALGYIERSKSRGWDAVALGRSWRWIFTTPSAHDARMWLLDWATDVPVDPVELPEFDQDIDALGFHPADLRGFSRSMDMPRYTYVALEELAFGMRYILAKARATSAGSDVAAPAGFSVGRLRRRFRQAHDTLVNLNKHDLGHPAAVRLWLLRSWSLIVIKSIRAAQLHGQIDTGTLDGILRGVPTVLKICGYPSWLSTRGGSFVPVPIRR
jgi:hypothetical protein